MIKKNLLALALIILFSLPAVRPLFSPGFPTTHDGVTHVVRFVKFHQALSEGQFPPRWSEGIAFGLGSPVLMYNSFLPYLSAEIPRLLGAGWSASIEIIFALSFILSGVTFYLWAKEVFGKLPGFVGALFYLYAPYRFIDIYVRGAYPESFAFIFPPLLLLAVKKMIEDAKIRWVLLAALSLSGLILSHNVMAILFMAIGFSYGIMLAWVGRRLNKLKEVGLSFAMVLLLTSVFWMPAYLEKGAVNLDYLNSTASYASNFVSLNQIIYSKWGWGPLGSGSPMSPQLGLTQILAVLLALSISILTFARKGLSSLQMIHLGLFLGLLFMSLFLMTPYSLIFWEKISLLAFFLYPWRWLTLAVFSAAVLSALVIQLTRSNRLLLGVLILLLLYSNRNFSQLVGTVKDNSNRYYESYSDTTDMWGEFLPVGVDLSMVKRCKDEHCVFPKVVVPEGVELKVDQKSSTKLNFQYISPRSFSSTINTLNFPGWKIYLNGEEQPIQTNSLGTMDVTLPEGSQNVSLIFNDTLIRQASTYLSFGGLAILMGVLWRKRFSF